MSRRLAAVIAVLPLAACGSPTRPEAFVEAFTGVVADAPMSDAVRHTVRVVSEGTLNATLSWEDVPSTQPAGRAELRLTLLDAQGRPLADTLDAPGGSPLDLSVRVAPGTHTAAVAPRFRDRIGFYCLCDVPYRLRVAHP